MDNARLAQLLSLDKNSLPPDGGDEFNRLIFARSPYLLQHADNPTDWREWGEEAFAEARLRNLPLFVSIGYATCHWCHVMAHESFNDPEVAQLLNTLFVPVKVDREERPDLDGFYMTASQVLTGSGGWPLNIFIDHDRRPFFSVTYLPKQPSNNTPGFIKLLQNISVLWNEKQQLVINNSRQITAAIMEMSRRTESSGKNLAALSSAAYRQLQQLFDPKYGGFGSSVKFPMAVNLLFLLSRKDDTTSARDMVLKTLAAMAAGGINDQLAGGFHRYSVDERWQVPHFEKMLYDQAMLVMVYSEAFLATDDAQLLATARSTARFVLAELATSDGAFCGALDADTEGEEGLFYTWGKEEIDSLLGESAAICREYWGVQDSGDLAGRNVLHVAVDPAALAAKRGMTASQLEQVLNKARQLLLNKRRLRVTPLRDPKVISAWNGLMVAALTRLYLASGEKEWLLIAERAARFILDNLVTDDGRLLRNWLSTPSPVPGFVEDYAYFCSGLVELASNSHEPLWKERLSFFGSEMIRIFLSEDGMLATAGSDAEQLPVNVPSFHDGVTPSPAGVAASLLIRMGKLLADPSFTVAAKRIIVACRGECERNPVACLSLIMAEEELEASE